MATTSQIVQQLYIAYFGRPADPAGAQNAANLINWSGTPNALLVDFGKSAEYTAQFSGLTPAQIVNKIYTNLFGRSAEAAGLQFWSAKVGSGEIPLSTATWTILSGVTAGSGDDVAISSKVTYGEAFTAKLAANSAAAVAYNSTTLDMVKTQMATVTTAATLATATTGLDSFVTSVTTGGANAGGTTFTLTTGIDTLTGTAGNDTFVADNAALSAADSVNGGAGTDTFKVYGVTAANALLMPAMSAVETLYLNGAAAAVDYNASGVTDLTNVTLDSQLGAAKVTVTTGQSVTLANNTAASNTTTIAGNTPTALTVNLDKMGQTAGATDTVDFSGTALTTVTFGATGTKSAISLTNTGAKVNKLVVTGDKALAITEDAATAAAVKTVDASANTGGVTLDKTAGAAAATFAFTGGAGNDVVLLKAGDLAAMTAGTQIALGAGTGDKVGILDLTAALTAPVIAKINAMTGVEVLGLNAAQAIDASTLTSIKSFSLDTNAIQSITKMVAGSSVAVTAAHAATFSAAGDVGVTDLALNIGTASTAGLNNGGVFTIAQTAVALSSNGTNAAANVLTVANADNSVITVTGSNDLTLTLGSVAPTLTGSKVDGTAFTGKLVVTGNTKAFATGSAFGDVLVGGTGADTIKAAINGGTLTGNAGADTFDVSVALGGITATYQTTTITDFTKGDKIAFAAGTAGAFTAAKVDLSGAASVGAALDLLAAGNNTDLKWGTYGGNTYIIDDVDAGATFAATDTMVKLTGTLDLSTSTFAGGVLTYA